MVKGGETAKVAISRKKAAIIAAIMIVFAVVSFFWISGYTSNPDNFQGTLGSLENKSSTVMELTAGSTALSAAITLIPGDIGTPIAEKLADLSGYFVFILAAIYVEKWLVTITGLVAFKYIIPLTIFIYNSKVNNLSSPTTICVAGRINCKMILPCGAIS